MLEFEDDINRPIEPQVNETCSELKPYNEGRVSLSISEYNDLLRRADAASNALKLVRRNYSVHKPIEVEIDKHWLYQQAMLKLHEQYGPDIHETYEAVKCADDLVVLDVTIARLIATKNLDL